MAGARPFLGIDTATSRASIALARDGSVLREELLEERGAHARDLLPRIESLLAGPGLRSGDLGGIGVSVGPGSFTGVRIGMATAKGLAYALDIGCAGLSTVEALARAAARVFGLRDVTLCPALEAGRGEVYAALFRVEAPDVARLEEDRSWRPAERAAALPPRAALVGDAAGVVARAAGEPGADLTVLDPWPPLAGTIALWAAGLPGAATGYRAGTLRPNYVRPADAEAKRRRS